MKVIEYIEQRKWLKYTLVLLMVVLLTFFIEKGYMFLYRNKMPVKTLSWDRLAIFFMFSAFLGLHLLIPVKKIWDFVYRKRYIIGVCLFSAVVLNGYHGSSMYYYNDVIQPHHPVENAPFLSDIKPIRSDEFLVDTPSILSQINHNDDFQTTNNALMARDELSVFMFPQLPTKSISVVSNPKLLGFLFLPEKQAFSFFWYLMVFISFFATFELAMLITKGKKVYSSLGACLLTFSPLWLWWGQSNIWISGCCAILFFNLFLKSSKEWKKLVYSALFGYAGSVYIMGLYPAWMIPFGYLFLGLMIWQMFEYKKSLRWRDLWYIVPVLLVMFIILYPAFMGSLNTIDLMSATVYPAKRVTGGGFGSELLYNYFISPFFTLFGSIANASESSQTIGLFPIPLLIGAYVCFKNFKKKDHDILLNVLLFFGIFLSVFNYVDMPLINKLTLLSMSAPDRSQVVVNIICVLIVIRLISKYETSKFQTKKAIPAALASVVFFIVGISILKTTYNLPYLQLKVIIVSLLVFVPVIFLLFMNNKKANKFLCFILISISLYNFATVQPISKGIDVMHEKPFAKEVKKILAKDMNAKWVVTNPSSTGILAPNYLLANGARVINSTNIYPNMDLWQKFDPKGKHDEVYNRYAHISINLTDSKTKFNLLQQDFFQVDISKDEAYKLDAKYFVSNDDLSVYDTEDYSYKRLYSEDDMYIFEFISNTAN